MKRCPDCGEKYSDTYRCCPFCEEEEALRSGTAPRRRGGYRAAQHGGGGGGLSTLLILIILVLACVLGWLLFGDKLGKDDPAASTSSSSVSEPAGCDPMGSGDISMPEEPNPSGSGETPVVTVDPATLPETLTLNKTDYTTNTADAPVQLKATGGNGSYVWSSSNESVAVVDENGKVTALSAGTANIYASDGSGMGVCIVRAKGSTVTPVTPTVPDTGSGAAPTTPSGGEQKLNREDFTLPVGHTFQLQLSGVTTGLTWKSKNPAVATVSSNGTVTAVADGHTTITVSWDGQERSCIVRVK